MGFDETVKTVAAVKEQFPSSLIWYWHSNHFIFCCDLQIERKKHSLDETSLNNVALICARPNTLNKETYVVTPALEVSWGWWETREECRHYEANFFLSEFSLQVEKFQVTEKSKIGVLAQNYIHGNGHIRYPSFRDTSLPQPLTYAH